MVSIRKADYYTMKVSQRPGAGKRRFGMVFWVKKKDTGRASRALGAR